MSLLRDETGKLSMGRILLAVHTLQNWAWIWLFITGKVQPLDSDTLNLLIGSLDVTMFIVFGGWVIGPRSFQYLFPQLGSVITAGSTLIGKLKGTDDRYRDDER